MSKNIYLIHTDIGINSVKDLAKLEEAEFATISVIQSDGYNETFNATQTQAFESAPFRESAVKAFLDDGLLSQEQIL